MMELILHENELNLKTLETNIFKMVCEEGCRIMAEILRELDKSIEKNRDKKIYRHKGTRDTVIKTLMGEVPYSRVVYEKKCESVDKKHIYLLDEYLGFDNIGLISSNLAEKMAEMVCLTSFKESAKNISELTGQTISHGGIWNLTQKLGARIEKEEEKDMILYKNNESKGEREIDVLFEEADGIMIKMQGKDRLKGKNQEMKIAIFHEGWEKEGKKRYRLHNKQVVNGFEDISTFTIRMQAKIASIYNTDEIKVKIFNSDGAGGLKEIVDDETIRQLDPFHVKKAIQRATKNEDIKKALTKLYEEKKIEELLEKIDIYANSMEDENEDKKLRKLYEYLNENKEDLIPYKARELEEKLPEAPEGIEYRGMGACEHNVFLAAGKRMKRRGSSWSKSGANNLGKILALKVSDKLRMTLEELTKVTMPEAAEKEISTVLSSSKAPKYDGKGYEGRVSSRPFANCARTNGRDAIDGMFDLRPLSELRMI